MGNQFEESLDKAFENADLISDDFSYFGFEEGIDDFQYIEWGNENNLASALKELDESLGLVDFQ